MFRKNNIQLLRIIFIIFCFLSNILFFTILVLWYFRFEEESDKQILDALVSKPDYDKRVRPDGKMFFLSFFKYA